MLFSEGHVIKVYKRCLRQLLRLIEKEQVCSFIFNFNGVIEAELLFTSSVVPILTLWRRNGFEATHSTGCLLRFGRLVDEVGSSKRLICLRISILPFISRNRVAVWIKFGVTQENIQFSISVVLLICSSSSAIMYFITQNASLFTKKYSHKAMFTNNGWRNPFALSTALRTLR